VSTPPTDPDTTKAIAALELKLKQLRGTKLTQAEQKQLDSYEKQQAEIITREFCAAVPKMRYCELAGRQVKSVNEFGERYGIACDEEKVNLFVVIKDFHTLTSELSRKSQSIRDLDEIELEREKLVQEVAKLQRQCTVIDIDISKKMETLVDRVDIVAGLEWLSAKLRALGTRIHSLAGQDGVDAVNEFLDDLTTEMERGGQLHF
jgi:hypothetical protein